MKESADALQYSVRAVKAKPTTKNKHVKSAVT